MPPAAILSSVSRTMCSVCGLRCAVPDAQQHLQVHGPREFRRLSEAAVLQVERGGQTSSRPAAARRVRCRRASVARQLLAAEVRRQLRGLLDGHAAPMGPGVRHGQQDLVETGHASRAVGGQYVPP